MSATHEKSLNAVVNGEEFELTMKATPDPMEMVRDDRHVPVGWRFRGRGVKHQAGRFKLRNVGPCCNLKEVRQKLGEDSIAEGQWRKVFRETYPTPDVQVMIGFADPSLLDPDLLALFPVLQGDKVWTSRLDYAVERTSDDCLWLVYVTTNDR